MHTSHICTWIAAITLVVMHTEALSLSPRIVGGVVIQDRCRAPYNSMVALQFRAVFSPITFCSAVMVSDTFLVTTAKCLITIAETTDNVAIAAVGEKDLVMSPEMDEQQIPIKSFKIHFFYNASTRANNIGLIELAAPAKLSRCVKPAIRIEEDPKACLDLDNTCQITGWGSYSETEATNSRLPRSAGVTVYSDLITTLLASSSTEQPPIGSLYAETLNPFQKACFFDWGGVVSCRRNGYNILRGIISDHNCNYERPFPILVLDIPYYQLWIDRCTKDWDSCPSLH